MPNSRFALHGRRPSQIHGLCASFASNSRFMRLFQAALDTCLDSPLLASLSVHGLHFTVYAASNYGPRNYYKKKIAEGSCNCKCKLATT